MIAQADIPRFIVDNLTTAVLLFDGGMCLRGVNPAAEVLLASSEKKILGLTPERIFPEADYWVSVLRWAMEARRPFLERGVELRRTTGELLTVDCTVTPLGNPDEESSDMLLVELVQVDRHPHVFRGDQVLAQHETTHAIVRGLAHEIRNPLGGLRGAAQLLQRELADPELLEYTQVIIGEADRLQGLLDRMLGPRTVPRMRPTNVHEVTDRVCRLVRAEAPQGVHLSCDYDPSIPDLEADPDLLIQAFLNVARNAVQAVGEAGDVLIRTRIERQVTIGARRHRLALRVDISDSGPGVAPDILDKIFYPLVSGNAGGTGLGLSIAQNLIHQHGGLIQCRSVPGETVMTTWLPVVENGA